MLKITFFPDSDKQEFVDATKHYQQIWDKEGKKIVRVIEKVSNLKFTEKIINAVVLEGGASLSHPLGLRASYPLEVKKATLIHELCHRLMTGNNIKFRFESFVNRPVEIHKILNLILYDIWVKLYGKDFADRNVEVERQRAQIFKGAWDLALGFEKHERKRRFKEIIDTSDLNLPQ